MSMQSDIGASTAATEIEKFVAKKIQKYQQTENTEIPVEELLKVLEEIRKKAQSIISSADAGYY